MDPGYWRAWRARNPAYRERQRTLRKERRAASGRGDRSAEYARQRQRRAEQRALRDGENGLPPTPDGLLVRAQHIARRFRQPDRRALFYRPTYEDLVADIALALVAGDDPDEAARDTLREERAWQYHTTPLL